MTVASPFEVKLQPNENVLWTGRGSGRNFSSHVIAPPAIIFCLMLILIVYAAMTGFRSHYAILLIGSTMVLAAALSYSWIRLSSPPTERYWITNQRILIAPLKLDGSLRSFVSEDSPLTKEGHRQFKAIKVLPKRKSVYFEPHVIIRGRRTIVPLFVGIEDAAKVGKIAADAFGMKLIIT
ncbi:MAG: hypothetical protein AAFV59_09990 [Pseudomonadota bacterium]